MSTASIFEQRSAQWTAVGLLSLAAISAAFHLSFVCDDAYISFQYARNLVEGHGLVWQPGDRVEGYTNPLWTWVIAGAIALGFDPAASAMGLGLASLGVTLALCWRLARDMLAPLPALLAFGLVALNYSVWQFATSGLATMAQTAMITGMLLLTIGAWRRGRASARRLAGFSTLAALALLLRPDSAVAAGLCGLALALLTWRSTEDPARRRRRLAALVGPAAALLGAWLAFKWVYYGDLLPNTFYLKVGNASRLRGLWFVSSFLRDYGLFFALFPIALRISQLRTRISPPQIILASFCVLWAAYVVFAGGDFLWFRFMVPFIPALFVLLIWALWQAELPRWVRWGAFAALLAFSGVHAAQELRDATIDDYRAVIAQDRQAALELRRGFQGAEPPTIAVAAAGVLPYYSRLPAVDMLGLSDAWVVRHGRRLGSFPGHQRLATLAYLERRGVDLIVGTPWKIPAEQRQDEYALVESGIFLRERAEDIMNLKPRILEIPIGDGHYLLVMQIGHDQAVDRAVRARRWGVKPLLHRPSDPDE